MLLQCFHERVTAPAHRLLAAAVLTAVLLNAADTNTAHRRAGARSAARVLVIRDVTVIDGTGAPPAAHQTIVIRGERIAGIRSVRGAGKVPAAALIIDGKGKYAIPGLWDMHVHLWNKENVLPRYVARGVTGVRDMGSDFDRTKAWRAAIESGKAIGPHILTPGPAVDGKPSGEPKLQVIVVTTPAQARDEFDRLDNSNVDFVKILSNLPRDAYFALAERSRHWFLPFAGHIPNGITAEEAIEARQASIEHLFNFPVKDEARSRAALERCVTYETRITPSLTLWHRMAEDDSSVKEALPKLERVVRTARDLHVPILAGTDTGDPGTEPGVTLQDELELLVAAGLTPGEALQSATVEPARFLGWDGTLGVLKEAMLADIVLLDGDPVADIRNVRRIHGVVLRGRYLNRARLKALIATPSAR